MTDFRSGDIAIIGMAGRFPGAPDIHTYWDNLCNGLVSTVELSDEQLRAAGVSEEMIADPDYVRRQPILDDIDRFDADFFGFLPREAELLDPAHRLYLECVWAALDDAGHSSTNGEHVGVYAGASISMYLIRNLLENRQVRQNCDMSQLVFATDKDHLATRTAYKLDLTGPALNINTACSTSLVAVHTACQGLLDYHCDMAVAGGTAVFLPQGAGYLASDGGMASPEGVCRPFDQDAQGTVFGSGTGVVVLKRHEDAVRDGDHIYALIRGTAINNDGADKVGYTAPSVIGQAAVIAEAQAVADVEPQSIQYVETHGTGTQLGDPIEIRALTRAFGADISTKSCALGSAKANIGHLDAASGIAGLIKAALALHHKTIPPTPNFRVANRDIQFEETPFYVNTELTQWLGHGEPRRAGVSSFGIGGSNAHVILQEASSSAARPSSRRHELLLMSAKTAAAAQKNAVNIGNWLTGNQDIDLANAAYTLAMGRQHFQYRNVMVVDKANDANGSVNPLSASSQTPVKACPSQVGVVFMFTGQGSQRPYMAHGIYQTEPVFRTALDHLAMLFEPHLSLDIRELVFPDADDQFVADTLTRTVYAQASLFAIEYALCELLEHWGLVPNAMLGHSLGEYVAATRAGVFSLPDAVRVVSKRGQLMDEMPTGAMLAVSLSEQQITPYLAEHDVCLAAVNGSDQCVASGTTAQIDRLCGVLEAASVRAVKLNTSHAFHSQLMDAAHAAFLNEISSVSLSAPTVPFISNVSGQWITQEQATSPAYWADHLRQPVRFADGVDNLLKGRDEAILEIGPGSSLTALASRLSIADGRTLLPSLPVMSTHDEVPAQNTDDRGLLTALGGLWSVGVEVDWAAFHDADNRARISLPTYPFADTRYWVHPDERSNTESNMADSVIEAESMDVASDVITNSAEPVSQAPMVSPQEQLTVLVAEASGLPTSEILPSISFLDLGLDSLSIVQLNRAIKSQLGVDIPFRQLFDKYPSIDSIVDFIEDMDVSPENVQPVSTQSVQPMSGLPVPPDLDRPGAENLGPVALAKNSQDGGLNAVQYDHIDQLVTRLTDKTVDSKRIAQQYRQALADPRVPMGFSRLYKELAYPLSVTQASGSTIQDSDGNQYIDLVMGFGVHLFGHNPSFVNEAVKKALADSPQLVGPHHEQAGEVAALFCELTGMERASFCNTGSESVMAALRIARTVTDRNRVVLFSGSYHGNFDTVLVRRAGKRTVPVSLGIPQVVADDVVILQYGSEASLEYLRQHGDQIAAVLVEPVQCRELQLQPRAFLHALREVTQTVGALLIFDEVVTGFRVALGGAQAWFDIKADLATYGKVLGGGYPIGVVAGKSEYMDAIDGGIWDFGDDSAPPAEQTAFAGTFCKHPLALTAAHAVLKHLQDAGPSFHTELAERTAQLAQRLNQILLKHQAPIKVRHFASILAFMPEPGLREPDLLYYHMRDHGISVWGQRPYFLSTEHSDQDLEDICVALEKSISALKVAGFMEPKAPIKTPLTPAQREVWVASQMSHDISRAYNTVSALRLAGPLHRDAVTTALQQLVDRHQALRTTFSSDGLEQSCVDTMSLDVEFIELHQQSTNDSASCLQELLAVHADHIFDLVNGPLIKVALLQNKPDDHVLVITTHHIICDGFSMDVVLRELITLYLANAGHSAQALPQADLFSDYANWLQQTRAGESGKGTDAFWRYTLAQSELDVLELPLDHPRPAVLGARSERAIATIPADLMVALKRVGSSHGATPFMTLLACFQVLMHRLSQQENVAVGVPVSGHVLSGMSELVGHCVNLVPVRSTFDTEQSFLDFLSSVVTNFHDANDHATATISELVDLIDAPRDPSRPPVCSVTFNYETSPDELRFADIVVTPVPFNKPFSQFELICNAYDNDEGLRLELDFNTELFKPDTITRWLEHFQHLIEGVVAKSSQSVGALPMLSAKQQQSLWPSPPSEAPSYIDAEALAHVWFEHQVEQFPTEIAITDVDSGLALSYQELNQQANRLARHLLSQGAGKTQYVGVCMRRTPQILVALLAILKTGAAYVPVDTSWPEQRIQQMFKDCEIKVLVTEASFSSFADTDDYHTVYSDDCSEIETHDSANLNLDIDPQDSAYVIYTSGSTGQPKGVMVSHFNMTRLFSAAALEFQFENDEVWACVHSYAFDFSVWETFGALFTGGRIALVPHWMAQSPEALLSVLHEQKVTVLSQTPTAFHQLIAEVVNQKDSVALNLRHVVFGGEALDPNTLRPWIDRYGDESPRLINMYGITETTVHVTHRRITNADLDSKGSCIGEPLCDLRVLLLDEHMAPVPVGVPGEIYVGGHGLAQGYLGQAELTAERYVSDPQFPEHRLYRTGDKARRLINGDIEYLGRLDQQIQLHGYRIELAEIEACLLKHATVGQVVTVVQTNNSPRIIAYVVPSSHSIDRAALRAFVGKRLPSYMVPAVIVELSELPRTSTGKINLKALPEPSAADAETNTQAQDTPSTESEETLSAIWAKALSLPAIGVYDNFFALGGDSIIAIQIVSRARSQGFQFTPKDLFQNPTVRDLVAVVTLADQATAYIRPEVGPAKAGPIISWFFGQQPAYVDRYCQSLRFDLAVDTDPRLLEQALRAVCNHHDAFRLRLKQDQQSHWQLQYVDDSPIDFKLIELDDSKPACEQDDFRIASDQAREVIDTYEGPLLVARYLSTGHKHVDRPNTLLLVAHHIAVDGVSWRILADDLTCAYEQLLDGAVVKLPPVTASYDSWIDTLSQQVDSPEFSSNREYWREYLGRLPSSPRIASDTGHEEQGIVSSERSEHICLNSERSDALLSKLPEIYHTSTRDLLVCMLARTLTRWNKSDEVTINLEGHGRDLSGVDADLSRTVGWFTNLYPVTLSLPSQEAEMCIKTVKETLRAIPDDGIGYGILRYLATDPEQDLCVLPASEPDAVLNYLGTAGTDSGSRFGVIGRVPGTDQHPNERRHQRFEIEVIAGPDGVEVEWRYSASLYTAETIQQLVSAFVESLDDFIQAGQAPQASAYTPSDFPDAGLSDDGLAAIMAELDGARG